jgi:hypothetical protein
MGAVQNLSLIFFPAKNIGKLAKHNKKTALVFFFFCSSVCVNMAQEAKFHPV